MLLNVKVPLAAIITIYSAHLRKRNFAIPGLDHVINDTESGSEVLEGNILAIYSYTHLQILYTTLEDPFLHIEPSACSYGYIQYIRISLDMSIDL